MKTNMNVKSLLVPYFIHSLKNNLNLWPKLILKNCTIYIIYHTAVLFSTPREIINKIQLEIL